MTTNDETLGFQDKMSTLLENKSSSQFCNLNLNHFQEISNISQMPSHKTTSTTKKIADFPKIHSCEENKNFLHKSKSLYSEKSSFLPHAEEIGLEKYQKKYFISSNSKNNSTLSLHIAAYENSVESNTTADSTEVIQMNADKKKLCHVQRWKNAKQFLNSSTTSTIQLSFELPRQQEQPDVIINPEVMQFKASQKLLNPTEGNSETISSADGRKVAPPYNAANVVKKLVQLFPSRNAASHFSSFEQELVSRIKDLLLHPEKSFEDLCFETSGYDEPQDDTDEESCHDTDEESDDPTYALEDNPSELKLLEDKYSEEKWREIIEINRTSGWSHLQHTYRKLRNRNEITRMKRYLDKGGSQIKKLRQLDDIIINEFIEWKQLLQIVHDRDIKDAALAAADKLGLSDFEASEFFIRKFKKKHRIVSRKITNFVTKRDLALEDELHVQIDKFKETFRRLTANTPPIEILNTDQTGVQMEMISKRTLTEEGAKKVLAVAQKADALTHSFTVQPVISASGKLLFPVFVTFHEPSVPQRFEEQLQPFRYIKAMSSSSGKMSSFLAKKWFEDVFKPQVAPESHLVVDSWTGYKQAFQNETKITIHTLPKKSTGELQPLDVFFNRQFKALYRVISDKIRRRHNNDFNISNRKGIATILQLTLCQMGAKEFENMIRYAWYKSGLTDVLPPPFLTPVQYCFDLITPNSYCLIPECADRAFIACANCEKYICFKHFVIEVHDCVDHLKIE